MGNSILHIIKDEKFFDGISELYDNISEISNTYLLIVEEQNYKFKYIKNTSRVTLGSNHEELKKILSSKTYDIVLFHSLYFIYMYYLFKYIRPDVKIIWWSWGYEIYSHTYSVPAIIDIQLFKPLTKKIYNKITGEGNLIYYIKYFIDLIFQKHIRQKRIKKILSRIDYMIPVLECERDLIRKKYDCFHAKLLYHPTVIPESGFSGMPSKDNILIGNSAILTNNHLDIWNQITSLELTNRTFYFPVNYGSQTYKDLLKNHIKSESNTIIFIEDFMKIDKYFSILKSCSFAIYGVMRQQAMGNINYCLENGIKLFLYKQSIPYLDLKKNGFIIFSIEDDLNKEQLNIPLSLDEALINYRLIRSRRKKKMECFNDFLKEIRN